MRTFGCNAFAHLNQGKLDVRALRRVMLGYKPGVKGYRLWCIELGNHKVLVSRDVVFTESEVVESDSSDVGGVSTEPVVPLKVVLRT